MVQVEEILVWHPVEAGKGLNYLTEQGGFHGDIWYLLLGFSTTVEPCVYVGKRQEKAGNFSALMLS